MIVSMYQNYKGKKNKINGKLLTIIKIWLHGPAKFLKCIFFVVVFYHIYIHFCTYFNIT